MAGWRGFVTGAATPIHQGGDVKHHLLGVGAALVLSHGGSKPIQHLTSARAFGAITMAATEEPARAFTITGCRRISTSEVGCELTPYLDDPTAPVSQQPSVTKGRPHPIVAVAIGPTHVVVLDDGRRVVVNIP